MLKYLFLLLPLLAYTADIEIVLGPAKLLKDTKGNVTPGVLDTPFGVCFDKDDNMFIVEYLGGRIHKYTPDGKLSHIAGKHKAAGYKDGTAMEATFNMMHNVVILENGDLLISDHKNNAVRHFNAADKTISTYAGTKKSGFGGDGGPADKATFNMVMSLGLSTDKKTLCIADIKNRRIRSIDIANNTISTVAGNGKKGNPKDGTDALKAPLLDPRASEYDKDGNLYIVERGGNALRVLKPNGKIYTLAGSGKKGGKDGPALEATMNGPKHLAIDDDSNVYLADDFNHTIRKYDPKAKTLTTILGKGEIKLNRPHGVTVHKGWLYISDSWNHRIIRMKLK
jgi:hypothetical protein